MKRSPTLLIYIFYLLLSISGCSFMGSGLQEPKDENSVIVVGGITIDLFEYRNSTQTYRSNVEVIVAGRYEQEGKTIHKNFWVTTDNRGYFFLSGVPEGDYALIGFRFQTVGPSYFLTVVNQMNSENDKFEVLPTAKLPAQTSVFKYPARGSIVSLRQNYFIIDRGQDVHQKVYYRYDNLRLATGKTLLEPGVVSYFRNLYPESSWFK